MRLGNLEAHPVFLLETELNSKLSVLLEYWSENELESFGISDSSMAFKIWRIEVRRESLLEVFWVTSRGMDFQRDGMKALP